MRRGRNIWSHFKTSFTRRTNGLTNPFDFNDFLHQKCLVETERQIFEVGYKRLTKDKKSSEDSHHSLVDRSEILLQCSENYMEQPCKDDHRQLDSSLTPLFRPRTARDIFSFPAEASGHCKQRTYIYYIHWIAMQRVYLPVVLLIAFQLPLAGTENGKSL